MPNPKENPEAFNPIWWLILLTFIGIGITSTQQDRLQSSLIAHQKTQEERQSIAAKMASIQQSAIEFQTYAGAFVSAILEERDDLEKHRRRLIGNIVHQDATVSVFTESFDEPASKAVKEYRARLQEMQLAVHEARDVLTMKNFWETASDLLVSRGALLKELNRQSTPAET